MKNDKDTIPVGIREKPPLPEFVVRQLVAGVELGRTDEPLPPSPY